MRVPTIGESINEVTLSQWLKADGAIINMDEPICEFESDKATLEFPAEAAGKLIYVAKEGEDLKIGDLVAKIDTSFAGSTAEVKHVETSVAFEEKPATPEPATSNYATGTPSPAAGKILAEKGIDPASVSGTGKDGRITKDDAQKAQSQASQPATQPAKVEEQKPATAAAPISATAFSRTERREKMSRMRRTIANRLVSAKNNAAMLTTGRDRLLDQGLTGNLLFAQVNAESQPFPNNHFDCVTIGFGLRNVTHKQRALEEMFRVLRPGGRALVLEFSHPTSQALSKLYDLYSFTVLPTLGRLITSDADSYRYLAESIRVHPDQETLKQMMEQAGLDSVEYFNLTAGVVALHVGRRL